MNKRMYVGEMFCKELKIGNDFDAWLPSITNHLPLDYDKTRSTGKN
jgi:hypothetical protein